MRSLTIIFCAVLIVFSLHQAQAEVPKLINYQGKLTTPQGALVDTAVSMQFSIYSDSTGGDPLWSEIQASVKVDKGIFNVLLGNVNEIPESIFTGQIRYLGVKVSDDPEMIPRRAIVSVGYAYNTDMVDGLHNSDIVQTFGDQTIDGVKTFDSIPVLPGTDPTQDNQSARKAYVDQMKPLSNVIFCWNGITDAHAGNRVLYRGGLIRPNIYNVGTDYEFFGIYRGEGAGFTQVLATKWAKTSGVSTITVHCLIWQETDRRVICKVEIGTQSGYVESDVGVISPQWHTFSVDVSTLTNGNTYDVGIQLGYDHYNSYYLGAIILIGS